MMQHRGTVRIETERLILRRFTQADIPLAYRNWTSDARVTTYLNWPTHGSEAVTAEIIGEWIASYAREDFYLWAIELKEIGEPIGSISVVKQDASVDMVNIGYCIGCPWWHRGIASEALGALLRFFFEEVGVNRIECRHEPDNPNSGRVMQHCGLRYEGTLRSANRTNNGLVDAVMYGMLKSDYEKRTKA